MMLKITIVITILINIINSAEMLHRSRPIFIPYIQINDPQEYIDYYAYYIGENIKKNFYQVYRNKIYDFDHEKLYSVKKIKFKSHNLKAKLEAKLEALQLEPNTKYMLQYMLEYPIKSEHFIGGTVEIYGTIDLINTQDERILSISGPIIYSTYDDEDLKSSQATGGTIDVNWDSFRDTLEELNQVTDTWL